MTDNYEKYNMDTEHINFDKLNRKMKQMGNRIALLEASLLNNMANNEPFEKKETVMYMNTGGSSDGMLNEKTVKSANNEQAKTSLMKRVII